jgi:uncharacterized protein
MIKSRPIPVSTSVSKPFWDAALNDRLAIQRCTRCRRYQHPPLAFCSTCHAEELEFEAVSRLGTIYSTSITYDARTPAFIERQPYVVAWVELDEQQGLIIAGNMPDTPIDAAQIGDRVEVYFEKVSGDCKLPQFRLQQAAAVRQ